MSKKILFCFLLTQVSAFCQISFENERKLIENFQMLSFNSEIFSADLNGDNTNDLIVTSSDGPAYISIYPNIQGDYTATVPKLIWDNSTQNEYPSGLSTIDVDNDGLLDIIFCNKYDDKINWFRNLGDFNFSSIAVLKSLVNGPELSLISDVNNDGLKDIIINLDSNDSISWLKNNGDGTFLDPQSIFSNSSDIKKILAKDLNNDGFPEIIIGVSNSNVYWIKNTGSGTFGAQSQLGNANLGTSFEFMNINNDSYLDYVSTTSYSSLITQLNQAGNTFSVSQLSDIGVNFGDLQIRDINQDGITDIVGPTSSSFSYLERLPNQTFNSPITLFSFNNVSKYLAEDINDDSAVDFILPLYLSSNTAKRLSSFTKNSLTNTYDENIISFYNGSVFRVKTADLDNDGKKDIISSFRSVVWNKNKGNGNFTSYKKISNHFGSIFTNNIKPTDIDNDNDIDIVATTQNGIEVYYNDANGNFSLGYSLPLTHESRNIDVADLNGDGVKDIVMTFQASAIGGTVSLAWIPGLNGTSFDTLTTIGTTVYGYEPYLLKCCDLDNDGDIDILTYSNEYSSLHLHTNNGTGFFTYNQIGDNFSAVCMNIEDYNNDGYPDIFAAGNYYPGIFMIKNNNGVFAPRTLIDYKKANEIEFSDLNGDGYKELIGTGIENANLGNLFYYVNNGTTFGNQIIINSENSYSSSLNIAIDDLNNDNKPDIVNSFYQIPKVSYFLNSSTLSIEDSGVKDNIVVYPIPFTETISWQIPGNEMQSNEVTIYDMEGKLIYCKKEIKTSSLDLNFLSKGFYIFNIKSGLNYYTRKIVRN